MGALGIDGNAYLLETNKFSLFKIVRPEKNYPFVVNNSVYFITNSRGIVEEYRREYYRLIKDKLALVDTSGGVIITNELKVKIFEKIKRNVLKEITVNKSTNNI